MKKARSESELPVSGNVRQGHTFPYFITYFATKLQGALSSCSKGFSYFKVLQTLVNKRLTLIANEFEKQPSSIWKLTLLLSAS